MKLSQFARAGLPRSACEIYFSSISAVVRISMVIIGSPRTKTGIGMSQNTVIVVTASGTRKIQNSSRGTSNISANLRQNSFRVARHSGTIASSLANATGFVEHRVRKRFWP